MAKTTSQNPADYIVSLNINGMEGRMARLPSPGPSKKREMLVVYGHHALIERWWGLLQNLNTYGAVTMPDLPGFGGMDSFYSIGRKPTIDNYADYLAAFIKMRYKNRRITIVAISFGFVVATRMLQRYPDLQKKVAVMVSIVGFMHQDDFVFTPRQRVAYSRLARVFSSRVASFLIRYVGLNGWFIREIYIRLPAGKKRFVEMEPTEFDSMMEFEVKLWQCNHVRTHWRTTAEFLQLDNCKSQINLPVLHVASKNDHYFNNHNVEQHMRVVFTDYERFVMNSKAHTPGIMASKKELAVMVPPGLRRALRQ